MGGALTVAQLCKRAQVARSTFYEHYREPWEPVYGLLVERFYGHSKPPLQKYRGSSMRRCDG